MNRHPALLRAREKLAAAGRGLVAERHPAAADGGLAGEGRPGRRPMSRWRVARWLLLPGLYLWGVANDVLAHPWHAALALVTAGALLARYRWPATALLMAALISAVPVVIVALPFLAYGVACRLASARRTVATLALAAVAAGGSAPAWLDRSAAGWPTIAVVIAGYVTVMLLLPAAIGAVRGERARRIAALTERNAMLEQAQRLGDLRARMQERARIAGEMHDLLGHRLSLIALYAGALELRTRDQQPALNSQADLIRGTASTALDELREVLGILRVDTGRLDDEASADGVGMRTDIESLTEASRAAGQPVTLDWVSEDLTGVDVRVRRAVHRVVREALTNVHKHAPQAPTEVSVRVDDARILIEVRNPLRPPQTPPPGTGLGLVGLRERARLVGGSVATGREDDEFVLTAALPRTVPAGGSDNEDPHIDHDVLVDRQTPGTGVATEARYSIAAFSRRSTDTMSKPVKIILASLIGAVVLACGGGIAGAYYLADKAKDAAISPAEFAAVHTGQTREEVEREIGDVGSLGKTAVDEDREPPKPANTTCDYAVSRKNTDDGPTHVYRFCYAGDKLVEKKEMIFPNAATTP